MLWTLASPRVRWLHREWQVFGTLDANGAQRFGLPTVGNAGQHIISVPNSGSPFSEGDKRLLNHLLHDFMADR